MRTASFGLPAVLVVVSWGCGDDQGASSSSPTGSGAGAGTGASSSSTGGDGSGATGAGASTGGEGSGAVSGDGFSSAYPGDVGIDAHAAVVFFEDFEDADVGAMVQGWDSSDPGAMSFDGDVPAGAVAGSQALVMSVPSGAGTTGVTLFKNLPTQQDTVYVRYFVKYQTNASYHHAGMWIGGFNPPSLWPQGTAGIRPSGSDFFHNAWEPREEDGQLIVDHYAQWPSMDCWMEPGGCYGNVFLSEQEPAMPADAWTCVELMLALNTPGESDGEYAVWTNDVLVQHLAPGRPTFNRLGNGVWIPDPSGTPFPGFDWRSTPDLGFNWIWLDFYVDAGPSSMRWDQVVVATERVGCMAPAT